LEINHQHLKLMSLWVEISPLRSYGPYIDFHVVLLDLENSEIAAVGFEGNQTTRKILES
jgi:hypothetical protein